MKTRYCIRISFLALLVLIFGCRRHVPPGVTDEHRFSLTKFGPDTSEVYSSLSVEQLIENLRNDSELRDRESKIVSSRLGIEVICTDPATHIFDGDGRRFHFNDSYGDLLEIPTDWIPAISSYGLSFSYHGAPICSPDSTSWLIPYSCHSFVFADEAEFYESMIESYQEDSLLFRKGTPIYQEVGDSLHLVHWVNGWSQDGMRLDKAYHGIVRVDGSLTDYSLSLEMPDNLDTVTKDRLVSYFNSYPMSIRFKDIDPGTNRK